MISGSIKDNIESLECSYNTRQSAKKAFEHAKETVVNLAKSAIIELLEMKNKAIIQASKEIRKIAEELFSTLKNIDTNIFKCTESLFKLNSLQTTSQKTSLIESCIFGPENQAVYIFFNRILSDLYFALQEDFKKKLQSKFDDFYFQYEKIAIEKISTNIESIICAQNKLKQHSQANLLLKTEIGSNYAKEEVESLFYQIEKNFNDLNQTSEIKFLYYNSPIFRPIFDSYSQKFNSFNEEYLDYMPKANPFNDKYIYYFTGYYVRAHNIENKRHKDLLIDNLKTSKPSLISIPNNKLFLCGSSVAVPCIINTENNATEKLRSGLNYQETGGTYYNCSVYIFGGKIANQNMLGEAHKYDLVKGIWAWLPDLPCPACDCSCVVFKNKILISGYGHSWLYLYDTLLNSYSGLLNLEYYNKVTAVGNSRAYLFEFPGNIYESGEEDEYSWKWVGANKIWGSNCYRVFYKGSFYLRMDTSLSHLFGVFCKFNLRKKKLKLIKENL